MESIYEKYSEGEIPHIHNSDDFIQNIVDDILCFQGERIKKNLMKYFPDKTEKEIMTMMFYEDEFCLWKAEENIKMDMWLMVEL